MLETQQDKPALRRPLDLRLYIRQQPVMLAVLAVICFAAVSGLSRAYHAQRAALGNRWFSRGVADLKARHFDSAVTESRAALLYSPDNYDYQLNLAEALIGLKRTGEAYSYLVNLWDQQPENGQVNLELARIAAQRGQTGQALHYYHNAIYAVWPGDQEEKRRDTRLELIEYLLSIHAQAEEQAELIALEENLGEDPSQQVDDLFLRAHDYEHALGAYHISLKSDPRHEAALAGAGLAAFQLGRYPLAERYLQEAVAGNPDDTQSADLLKTTERYLVFGLAFLGEGGTGKYGDIFYDRVEQVHRDFGSNVSSLLGTVAAHKLDHLLLGSHAYYYAGVTAPAWNEDIFRRMEMGSLLFTGAQAARMRTRIRGGDASLVSLKAREEK
jgi:tetratricopeptide (TPR) repeat protein